MAAAALCATALAAAFQEGTYKGTTSQHESVQVKFASRHRVSMFHLKFVAHCEQHPDHTFPDDPTHRFSFTGSTFKGSLTYDNSNDPAVVVHAKVTLSGRPVSKKSIKGTYGVVASVVDRASGEQIDTCRTGTINWSAKR